MSDPAAPHRHDHENGHAGHDHGLQEHVAAVGEGRLRLALIITAVFMLAEAAGGWYAGSLALVADAGHMLSDAFSLGLAYVALRLASRPADHERSFGYGRAQVLAAFSNGMLLLFIALLIAVEAVKRLISPVEVSAPVMLAVAAMGLAANIAVFRMLHGAGEKNINIRGALLHVVGDLLGSAGAVIAALIILAFGWVPADPLLSIAVAALILRSAVPILRESGHILLEGTPRGLSAKEVSRALLRDLPEVGDVHHVHIWSLDPAAPLITLHVVLREGVDARKGLEAVQARLKERFGLAHATIQIEEAACADDRVHGTAAGA